MKYLFLLIFLFSFALLSADNNFFDDSKIKNTEIQKGIEFYQSLEFGKSINIFKNILKKTGDRFEKAVCYKYLAFIYTLKQDDENTEKYYSELFKIYPDFELDYTTVTPKISNYFKDFHEIWLRTPGFKVKVYPLSNLKITYDAGVKLKVEWHDPNYDVSYVKIKYKKKSDKEYSEVTQNEIKIKNHYAYFNLSFLNDPMLDFTLLYYLELYDGEDNLIFKIGDEKNPYLANIKVPGGNINSSENIKTQWYQSKWFIIPATAVTLALIGVGGYYFYLNSVEGEPDEAQLNIYITNGN